MSENETQVTEAENQEAQKSVGESLATAPDAVQPGTSEAASAEDASRCEVTDPSSDAQPATEEEAGAQQ